MLIHKAYRYELDSNNHQRTLLLQNAGVARFVYNWGFEQRIKLYKEKQEMERFTSGIDQHKLLNSLKKTRCKWYGFQLIVAPRTFPSSKKCSRCGCKKKELTLSTREYICEKCGLRLNRNLNAALNLVTVSLPETITACGEDVSLLVTPSELTKKQTSLKQEPNISHRP